MNKLNKIHISNKNILRISLSLIIVFSIVSWLYIFYESRFTLQRLFDVDTMVSIYNFIIKLSGSDQSITITSRFNTWLSLRYLAYETLLMSICAIGLSALGAISTCMFAARNFHDNTLFGYSRPVWKIVYLIVRSLYSFTRAIPELILAIILMLFFMPGIWVAALALSIHNLGVLGKLYSECIEDMDPSGVKALQASGGRNVQLLAYAMAPQLLPQFLTYLLYRWEVVIRTTVVVGLVSAAGLGREFRLSFSYFHYSDLGLLLLWYVLLVLGVDLVCSLLRKLISVN